MTDPKLIQQLIDEGMARAEKVGAATAHALAEAGCRIVAVSDVSTGLYQRDGLDVVALEEHVHLTSDRRLEDYDAPSVAVSDNQELLGLDVDLLETAALEAQITVANHFVRA